MAKRNCANCGEDKDVKNGRICEKAHFICAKCVGVNEGIFFDRRKKKCPVCSTNLT